MKLQIGIVGLGNMGAVHARNLGKIDNVELVGICDVDAERALQIGEEVDVAAYLQPSQMMQESGCTAVLIATPHPFHREVCEEAANRGLHVLCEKPLAVHVADADAMVQSCHQAGVMLGVVFQQRTEPPRRAMKRIIVSGELGEIYRMAMTAPWYRPQFYYDSGAWRGTWSGEGGGILMNQAPHSLDQLLWLGLPPQSVQAITSTRLHSIEVENTALAILDYGLGATGMLSTSTAEVLGSERLEIFGDKGVLQFENGKVRHYQAKSSLSQHLQTSTEAFGSIGGEWREVDFENEKAEDGAKPGGAQSGGHNAVVHAFAEAVLSGDQSKLIARGEDGVASLELANAILMAGIMRREVQFPLDRAAYKDVLSKLQSGELKV